MKSILSQLKFYLRRVYRLSIDSKKWEDIVWNDLKKINNDLKWNSGIHEQGKIIELTFKITDDVYRMYYFYVYDGYFTCRVILMDNFDEELVSDMFILATHFNNLLRRGQVMVNPKTRSVEFFMKESTLLPLLYPDDMYNQIFVHHNTSKDIYTSFNRLVNEGESPAIIIADLINNKNQEDGESSSPDE